MKAPVSIFALDKAAQNERFSKAISEKYGNAGAAHAGVFLVFLNLNNNPIIRTNTEETIQIIYQLMLQWNNRQSFPLAKTTVISHIREKIERDLQILSSQSKELYRELNLIWQGIRMLDRKEASDVNKKRARRREKYLQKERRKLDEKIQNKLTQIRQTAAQAPARLLPTAVQKSLIYQLRQEQALRTDILKLGYAGKEVSKTGVPNIEAPEAKPFSGFIYRDSYRELYTMLEHRPSAKTVPEYRRLDELTKKTGQKQVAAEMQAAPSGMIEKPAGVRIIPAGLQTVYRIANRQINQLSRQNNQPISMQVNQQADWQLPIEAADRGVAAAIGIDNEIRLRNLSEIFTGFIYRDSFRELYSVPERRLPDKRVPEQRLLSDKTVYESIVNQTESSIENRQINLNQQIYQQVYRQLNQQISQQISRQINQSNRQINRQFWPIEKHSHRIIDRFNEIGGPELSEAEVPGTQRTQIPMAGDFGMKALREDAKIRLRNFGEVFTSFIYRDSFRQLFSMLEHRFLDKKLLEHQPSEKTILERRLPGERQQTIRQNQIYTELQKTPAEIQEVLARDREIHVGLQIVNRNSIVNRQISQISRQINQRTKRLLQTEAADHGFTAIIGIDNEIRLRNLSEIFNGFIYRDSFRELYRMLEHRQPEKTGSEYRLPSDKTTLEHRLTGEIYKMIRSARISPGVQEASEGFEDIYAGTQIENHIVNRQTNRQINQQINQQVSQQLRQLNRQIDRQLMHIEELPHRPLGKDALRKYALRKDAEIRLRSLGELFTGFIYHGRPRLLPGKLEQLLTEKIIRQNQTSQEAQEVSAGLGERQITVWNSLHLLKTVLERQKTKGNINTVMVQHYGQGQADIRQRDILKYKEAKSLKVMLQQAYPGLAGQPAAEITYPAPGTAHPGSATVHLGSAITHPGSVINHLVSTITHSAANAQNLRTQTGLPVGSLSSQPLKYLTKQQLTSKPSEQETFLNPIRTELQYLKKKEAAKAETLREQKQSIRVLMEKINIQEQVIEQMKNARQGQNSTFGKAEVKMVADTVLERLYKDVHLQRLRMGMN